MEEKELKCIGFLSQKGGCGKTSSVQSIAACLNDLGYKVLVIDLDQQCNLTKYVRADLEVPTIYDVFHLEVTPKDAIQHLKEFDFISASQSLSKLNRELTEQDDMFLLSDIVKKYLPESYDFVLLDCGPARDIIMTNAYVASDYVISPTECDDGGIDGIKEVIKDVDKLRNGRFKYSHAKILGFILTKYENAVIHNMALDTLKDMADQIEDDVFVEPVRKGVAVSECKTARMSLQEYAKFSNPAVDYRKITKEIVERC